ncbi:MAG: DUF2235 domain-containing protein [Nitrospira sp.]|nr:DUF2235 domain-containing protein [Nitrospira sp.]
MKNRYFTSWAALAVMAMLSGCQYNVQYAPNPTTPRRFAPDELAEPKQISVFFDGTSNNWRARTNVRRSFELLGMAEDPHYPSIYVEGVGTKTAIEKAFGWGMKDRVIDAYCFLAKYWSTTKKDRIRIFGFSRGSFEARMLIGLMAHCGLPDATNPQTSDKELRRLAKEVYKYCETHLSDPYQQDRGDKISLKVWEKTLADNQAKLQSQPFCKGWAFHNPAIQLLGIWDTVPGLPFDKLREDGEVIPGKAQRYKVRPYPNIKLIVHALSLDEKRSQFHPLLVGPPIDPANKVYEVWFPGAHSDIGGGYSDSNDMAGTALAWMDQVMQREKLIKNVHSFYRDAHGILHHPEENMFSSIGSHKQARLLPYGSHVDFSVFKRANLEPHPEDGKPNGVVYEPTLHVVQPNGSVKTLKIVGSATYKPYEAKKLLQSVGLDLYDPTLDIDNRPEGAPLTLSQMNVEIKDVPKAPEAKPAGAEVYPQ